MFNKYDTEVIEDSTNVALETSSEIDNNREKEHEYPFTSSLAKFMETDENEFKEFTNPLIERLVSTPKHLWQTEKDDFIISFSSRQKMFDIDFTKFNVRYMESLPIVIVRAPLNIVNEMENWSGVML